MTRHTIVVFGTFDTKNEELEYLCEKIKQQDADVIKIDTGIYKKTNVEVDFKTTKLNGENNFNKNDVLLSNASQTSNLLLDFIQEGKANAVISMGGGQGTMIANEVFSKLPVGFPKLLISTIANNEGSTGQFSDIRDTLVMNPIVDILGLNSILRTVIAQAAAAIVAMSKVDIKPKTQKGKIIGMSCWGVTTPCVSRVKKLLEAEGHEVLVFHANGEGGKNLETLIREGKIDAVTDISLPEITMPIAGSEHHEIPSRLKNAVELNLPMIVVPGGVDMIHIKNPTDIPMQFSSRKKYWHLPNVLFVRSNKAENRQFASEIAKKLAGAKNNVKLMLPLKGLSSADAPNAPLYSPEINETLFNCLKQELEGKIEIIELAYHINDVQFAQAIANELVNLLNKSCES